jgi:chemotaxis protein histidine kinase CheA
MDDLLSEFLIETSNRLAVLDGAISRFPVEPGNSDTQSDLIELFHTIKGASSFLDLVRLEAIAEASEGFLRFAQGGTIPVSADMAASVVEAIDVVRPILRTLATGGAEPAGNDAALIAKLRAAHVVPERDPAPEAGRIDPSEKFAAARMDEEGDSSPAAAALVIAPDNISLPLERLESFAGLVGQLVQTRNNLTYLMRDRDDSELEDSVQRLSHITSDLGNNVVATRRQALGQLASQAPGGFDIVMALTVSCGGRRFAIPQRSVLELVWVTPTGAMGTANDEFRYLRLRDERHPWIRLSTILGVDLDRALARRREIVIMMRSGDETIGLSVEQVFDAEEIVVRPQPPLLAHVGLYSGNTILGDGSVAMLIDPAGILGELRGRQQRLIGERATAPALPSGQKQ